MLNALALNNAGGLQYGFMARFESEGCKKFIVAPVVYSRRAMEIEHIWDDGRHNAPAAGQFFTRHRINDDMLYAR